MQSVSSRIWIRVAVSISYDDNDYTTGTFSWIDWPMTGQSYNPVGDNIVVNKLELQACYYIHFWTNTLRETYETPLSL